MRIAYFDCFSGVSGDMMLGALLDAGVDESQWRQELARLAVPGYRIAVERVVKEGISATDVDVIVDEADTQHGRHLADIERILCDSGLSPGVQRRAIATFRRLAEAEAKIHATTADEIHFHEVGAIDAIVDIVGACIGMELLEAENVYVSPLPLNRGWVECAHGTMPVPAPATLELLTGFAFRPDERPKELITPTGAALLAEFAERGAGGEAAAAPAAILRRVGYGAGKRDTWIPNLLRIIVADTYTAPVRLPFGTRRAKKPAAAQPTA